MKMKPRVFITDRLQAYRDAFKKEYGVVKKGIHHEREQQDGYHQYAVKMINNGKDTAYKVIVETKSNEISSSRNPPFNLPVDYQVWIFHSVKPDEKTIHFKINFEDVAGNSHTRSLEYQITDDKLMGESISWVANKPISDNVKV